MKALLANPWFGGRPREAAAQAAGSLDLGFGGYLPLSHSHVPAFDGLEGIVARSNLQVPAVGAGAMTGDPGRGRPVVGSALASSDPVIRAAAIAATAADVQLLARVSGRYLLVDPGCTAPGADSPSQVDAALEALCLSLFEIAATGATPVLMVPSGEDSLLDPDRATAVVSEVPGGVVRVWQDVPAQARSQAAGGAPADAWWDLLGPRTVGLTLPLVSDGTDMAPLREAVGRETERAVAPGPHVAEETLTETLAWLDRHGLA